MGSSGKDCVAVRLGVELLLVMYEVVLVLVYDAVGFERDQRRVRFWVW